MGLPVPCSGNFADVYAVVTPQRKWAVKCFTREIPGLRERYIEISKYLAQNPLPFMVEFRFLDQGIRVRGQWYPVLKMHWVEGFTLNAFVRDSLDKPATLDALGRIWRRMAERLREAGIAHGDLQHGNVLLVPDVAAQSLAVKLIDYDGMWVPALAGTPSGEVGHPCYQHPQRAREGTYSPEVDRFPHLVIYTALRAVAVGGRPLWEKYDNGDNLLFRQADLEAPNKSALFAELLKLEDRATRSLVEKLIDAARKPLEQSPLLEDVLPGPRSVASSEASRTAPAATPTVPAPPPVVRPARQVVVAQPVAGSAFPELPHRSQEAGRVVVAQPVAGSAFPSFQPSSERSRRRQGKPAVWLAVAGALGLGAVAALAVIVVVIVLFASRPADSTKGPQVASKDTNADKESKTPIRDKKSDLREKEDSSGPAEIRPTTWRSLAPMPTARSLLATVTGPDGRIYAIGGENASGRLDIVEVYDPSTNTWARAAPMPTARNHLAATVGPDNLIYAIGGVSSIPKIVEAYNPSTNKWTTVAPTPTARHGMAAVTGPDGRIYAIGGTGPGGVSLSTVEAYDTKTNTWTTVASMPTARAYLAAATGPDGRIYAIGGFVEKDGKLLTTVEAYDTMSNTWTIVAPMPTARNALAAVTGPDGRIYAIGGHVAGGIGGIINTVEAYNPSTNTWTPVANMPTVRGQLAATTGRDGCIYVIGGGNVSFLNTVEALSFSPSK
jgi:N-acetylneuraminic acid mutarotase/serine/threonine protein kinase